MAGGSRERESPKDQQCRHCGRYYSDRGIKGHEDNCDFCEYDVVLVPLEDADEGGDPPMSSVTPELDEPEDAVGDSPTPQGATPSEAVTDGGTGLGLSGPPSPPSPTESADDVEQIDAEPEPVEDDDDPSEDCPSCGEDLGATEDEIRAAKKPRCSECGTRLVVT